MSADFPFTPDSSLRRSPDAVADLRRLALLWRQEAHRAAKWWPEQAAQDEILARWYEGLVKEYERDEQLGLVLWR